MTLSSLNKYYIYLCFGWRCGETRRSRRIRYLLFFIIEILLVIFLLVKISVQKNLKMFTHLLIIFDVLFALCMCKDLVSNKFIEFENHEFIFCFLDIHFILWLLQLFFKFLDFFRIIFWSSLFLIFIMMLIPIIYIFIITLFVVTIERVMSFKHSVLKFTWICIYNIKRRLHCLLRYNYCFWLKEILLIFFY